MLFEFHVDVHGSNSKVRILRAMCGKVFVVIGAASDELGN